MKTHVNLYASICSFENLLAAAKKAQQGKRFQENVARCNVNLENELVQLQRELWQQTYQPGGYREFIIYEPKQRMISAAPYRDRVVHHALCNVIAPLFERTFIFDSYANRVGKGTHAAILRYQEFCRKNPFALKCDIKKYFPSIDHELLKAEIRRTIACPDTLWLIDRILDGSNAQEPVIEYFPGDDLFTPHERQKGLPIGNLTSQFFANVYLNRFDHFIKEILQCRFYLRYVDDSVVLGNDKAWLWEIKAQIETYLEHLRLRLHEHKCQIRCTDQGVTFLGFRVFPEFRLLRRDHIVRAQRRLRRLQTRYAAQEKSLAEVTRAVHGWLGHAAFGDTYHLREKLFAEHPFKRS
ncbi:MAG: reverse transcriptase domain-containing protein [bacterium]